MDGAREGEYGRRGVELRCYDVLARTEKLHREGLCEGRVCVLVGGFGGEVRDGVGGAGEGVGDSGGDYEWAEGGVEDQDEGGGELIGVVGGSCVLVGFL